jgi:hypothetical protein
MAEEHNAVGSVIIVAVTVGTLHADFLCVMNCAQCNSGCGSKETARCSYTL